MTPKQQQTQARRAYLAQHYATTSNTELAEKLGVNLCTISEDARILKLRKPPGHKGAQIRAAWIKRGCSCSDEVLEIIDLMYPVMTSFEMSQLLGLDAVWITKAANKRGIRHLPETRQRSYGARGEAKEQQKAATPKPPKPGKTPPPPKMQPPRPVLAQKMAPPMSAAERERHEKLRVRYTPDTLPWKARVMTAAPWTPPDLTYRGMRA